jgi:alanine dehydrogenase
VRVLTCSDVERLLDAGSCIAAVEAAFRMKAAADVRSGVLGVHVDGGGFHVKASALPGARPRFAAKINANFPANPRRRGLPTIQGVLALFDAETGEPLAVMDSIAITILRTAAATAIAAKHLARADASVVTIIGCGAQARAQLIALRTVRRISRVFAFDVDRSRCQEFAREVGTAHELPVTAAADLATATRASDIVVTCTPSRRAFLGIDDVRPGTFIAAVGADSEQKQEIEPTLLASSIVVVDSLEQCAAIGDLHHAIAGGLMAAADVRAELGEVIVDSSRGRRTAEEIVVFDSTGVAVQDVAAAVVVYERAVAADVGLRVVLGA